jgi:hypothetical protein
MPEKYLTQVAAQTDALADGDLFLITDVSDTSEKSDGSNKKLTFTQIKSGLDTAGYIKLTDISVTDSGGDGSLSYDSSTGVFTYTGPSAAEVRAHLSVGSEATASGDGAISYNNSTGVFTYTPPTLAGLNGSIDDLSDVTLTSTATNDILRWNGLAFVNTDSPTLDALQFDLTAAETAAVGQLAWNSEDLTLDLGLDTNVTLQIGQEQLARIKATSDIRNGMAVYVSGVTGGSDNLEGTPFSANSGSGIDELRFLGIATETLSTNDIGFVTTFGKVRGVDGTTYASGGIRDNADTESWSVGDILYASPNIAGTLTSVVPTSPDRQMPIAIVLKVAAETNLTLFVRAEHGYHLNELHDVLISGTPADNEILAYDSASGNWINQTAVEAGTLVHTASSNELKQPWFTASSTDTLTNKTFDANGTGNSLSNVETADIASGSKSGSDTTLITGTAGTDGNVVTWNADGDAVDSGYAVSAFVGGVNYQGTWNASTNSPTIPTASSSNKGYYYKVSVAGSTSIDGETDWKVGDWIISNGTTWDKVDNTESVSSVFGRTGAVTASFSDISGTATHEQGGLEADVSAYSGLIKISGGATSAITDNSSDWDTAFGWGDHSLEGYLTNIDAESISSLADVTITSIASGEILKWSGTAWINNTLAEAGIAATGHTHATSDITSGTFADARIAQSNVTQHQAALSITESQISDLGSYISNVVGDTTPQLGGQLDVNGNAIGDGTRELLTFTEDGSAVNHINIENEATGGGPIIRSTGTDTNVDLNLQTKGSGDINLESLIYSETNKRLSYSDITGVGTGTALTITSAGVDSGNTDGATGGALSLKSGDAGDSAGGNTGNVTLVSGASTTGNSGSVEINSGGSATGSGSITLRTGSVSSSGSAGDIILAPEADVGGGTYGDVRPDGDGVQNLGTASNRWKAFYQTTNYFVETGGGANYVAFTAPSSIASDVTWTLPNADGSSGQVLSTNGSGTLSWVTASGGGGIALTDLSVGAEASASGDGAISYDNTTGVFTYTPPTAAGISAITASSTDTLTNKTFDANGTGNSLSNVETADIASGSKTGSDTTLVTGTAGTNGNLVSWNADGDAVDSSIVASNVALTDGDTYTGTHDFGGATLEIPNGAAPSLSVAGQIALDTSTTDHTALLKYHDGTNEFVIPAILSSGLSTTDNDVIAYNAANNRFEMEAQSGSGGGISNVVEDSTPQLGGQLDVNGNHW